MEYLHQALALFSKVEDRSGEAATLYAIARVERDRANLREAYVLLGRALNIVESLRNTVDLRELRTSYFTEFQKYYEFGVDLLFRLHRQEPSERHLAEALQLNERSRARTFLEILSEAGIAVRQGVDPVLFEQERKLQEVLASTTSRLTRLLSSKHTPEQAATARRELDTVEMEYAKVQAQIRTANPHYAALVQPRPLNFSEIQQQVLDPNALLLEYALGEDRSFLWLATTEKLEAFELSSGAEIEAMARRFCDLLTARGRTVRFETREERRARIQKAELELPQATLALSRVLLGPLKGRLNRKRLLIVADGALQYIPFGVLHKPGQSGGTPEPKTTGPRGELRQNLLRSSPPPLIVDHEIVNLPSASTLAVLRRQLAGRRPAPMSVAVLADPVFDQADKRVRFGRTALSAPPASRVGKKTGTPPIASDLLRSAKDLDLSDKNPFPRLSFTRREAEMLAGLTPSRERKMALDFAASRTTATSPDLAQYRIVHFATHGLLNNVHPELSGLVFSLVDPSGDSQDGFLSAPAIFNLSLPAELVVLSGCQTGLGKEVSGEGLVGLTRGFMYAGAARVLVSLWKIHDEATAELMTRFYQSLLGKQRLSPVAALRTAQVSMWKDKRWSSPYYWAGFVLQGEPRQTENPVN
jgi:CHAT domain-containing protein